MQEKEPEDDKLFEDEKPQPAKEPGPGGDEGEGDEGDFDVEHISRRRRRARM